MKKADSSPCLTDEESVRTRTALFHKYVYPYRNLIYHLCIKHTRDRHNIGDNYNEVLANFFRYIGSYDPRREVKTWIYAITVRMLADLERKNNRFTREGDVGAMRMEQLPDTPYAPEVTIENYREMLGDEVLEALEQIGRKYREALLLQVGGYRLEEIMEILYRRGCLKTRNLETTKSRLFLAKKKLKERLTRDGKRKENE